MVPDATGQVGARSDELDTAITRDFRSISAFKTAFNQAATSCFGFGWAWLIVNDGKLQITSISDQYNLR